MIWLERGLMTEKDVQESKEKNSVEDQEKEELVEEVAETKVAAPKENSDSDQIQKEDQEPSEFLLKWQERHEAFLAAQKEHEKPIEEEKTKSPKNSLFKKKKTAKMDPISVDVKEESHALPKETPKTALPKGLIWKVIPIISTALSFVIICLYFITPIGKMKNIQIEGNTHVESAEIVKDSLIQEEDYVLTTLLNKSGHERNIKHSNTWVKDAKMTYTFPNKFTISIQEYKQIGYVKRGEKYYSVLSSGEIADTETPHDQLPPVYTTIYLTDPELIKDLVLQLATVNQVVLSDIRDIHLTPSKVTNDLLTLTMMNGNKILIPLSDIDFKLPYYEKIAPQLEVVSVIDMEVGIFSYASQ